MISVVMATRNSAAGLADALADLIPAVVSGLVTELVIGDAGSGDGTLAIADDAGADVVSGGLPEACAAAKGAWLMALPPSPVLDANWRRPVADHVERCPGIVGLLKVERRSFWKPVEGVVFPRSRYAAADGIAALARKLGSPSRTLRILLSDRPGSR